MPPATSLGSHEPRFTTLDRAQRVRFRRAVMLMVMTLVAPGSAQLAFGNRRVGRLALRLWLASIVLLVLGLVTAYLWQGAVLWAGTSTALLQLARFALMGLAVGWAYLFVDAWRLGQPLTLQRQHRLAVVGVNGFLCFTVAGTLLFGAHVLGAYRGFMLTFDDGEATGANNGRYNVLLLGGDSGAGRWGLRPDSMTVASIDADTGRTVLISLPRNMQDFPFSKGSVLDREFPDGFDVEGQYLNSLSTWALDHSELFGKSRNPGVDATVMGVEGITGLDINYWAMVNLEGFKDLVDAFGGVELNVRQPIPVGLPHEKHFHYIKPGVRKLDGHDTLWFARAREGSDDYSRMARQKCVMNAMVQQVSPQDAVRNIEKIAKASSAMLSTDLPRGEIDRFAALALKARQQKLSTLSLVPPLVNTADPDIPLIHAKVAEAIARSEGARPPAQAPPPAPAPAEADAAADDAAETGTNQPAAPAPATSPAPAPPTPLPVTGGSIGSLSEGYAANQADDLGAVC